MHLLKVEAKSCAGSFVKLLVELFVTLLLVLVEIFVKGNSASELLLDRQPLQKVPSAVTPSVHFSPTW